MRMNKILQSGLAIVLAICLLLPGGFLSEAALAEDTTMDGTVRVYLSSLGSPSRLDITICGSYSLDGSGATALANGSHAAGVWGGGWRSCWWRKPGSGASPPWGCRCMNPWASSTCPWK